MAPRSCASSRSGTRTDVTPARSDRYGYASNERHAYTTSAPGSPTASSNCWATPTDPQPTATCSGGTSKRAAMASMSSAAPLSGYLWTLLAASAITLSTEGSGPNGDSLDESLNARPPGADGALPGL